MPVPDRTSCGLAPVETVDSNHHVVPDVHGDLSGVKQYVPTSDLGSAPRPTSERVRTQEERLQPPEPAEPRRDNACRRVENVGSRQDDEFVPRAGISALDRRATALPGRCPTRCPSTETRAHPTDTLIGHSSQTGPLAPERTALELKGRPPNRPRLTPRKSWGSEVRGRGGAGGSRRSIRWAQDPASERGKSVRKRPVFEPG